MRRITVLLTSEPDGGFEPFRHGDLEIVLHPWSRSGPLPLFDGPVWYFIDWLLPDMPGIEACRRLRCDPLTAQAHVTMVLDEDDGDARRRALRAGADDYILGPLSRATILDRILTTHSGAASDGGAMPSLAAGDLAIEVAAFQARWQGKPIALMPNEFRLLRYFVEHPGRVYTRTQLIAALRFRTTPKRRA